MLPCSSPRRTAATSPASNCSSMAAWPRSRHRWAEMRSETGVLQWRGWDSRTRPTDLAAGRPSGTADDEPVPSAGLIREEQVMPQEAPGRGDPIGPLDLRKIVPFEPAASSDRLGWVGLEAVRCRAEPALELNPPAITHHWLVLFARPPE